MTCEKKIKENLLFDCADMPKKGLDGQKAVIINLDDIDRSGSVESGATISDLVLKSGTAGFEVQWYKDLASGGASFAPSTEDIDGFLENFLCRLSGSSAANAERANELKQGRFVMVLETRYKGALDVEAFKVLGWENGLKLSEMAWDTLSNSGSMPFTLSTEEGDVEQYPFRIFNEGSYAVSKATYDTLFATI